MKNSMKSIVLGSTTLLAVGAANAATDTVAITATIVLPVSITDTQALNFGDFTTGGAGGTVIVDNLGAVTSTGTPTLFAGTGEQAGGFRLKGGIGRQVDITAPASVNISNGGTNLAISNFTVAGGGVDINATAHTHVMVAVTDTGLRLGGTLTFVGGEAAGAYTGSVTLTAVYN